VSIRTAEEFDALIARIKEQDREINAWRAFSGNTALKAARIGEFDHAPRPLEGLTVGVKDIIDVEGLPTRYGSPLFGDAPPAERDATVIARMREAGAIIVGKTVTTELATFVPAETRNPRDLTRTPGGSSSGSAAAVAAGHVDIAIGTQTAGSIIRPAAYCGVYGFKPSFGLVPTDGVLVQCPSFDTVGVFARSLEHIEAWSRATFPASDEEAAAANREDLRLRIPQSHLEMATPEVQAAMRSAIDALIAKGVRVEEILLPAWADHIESAHATVQSFESSRAFQSLEFEVRRLSPRLAEYVWSGLALSATEYESAQSVLAEATHRISDVLGATELLLLPNVTEAPGEVARSTGTPLVHRLASALGLPAIAVPATSPDVGGFWCGVQLVGERGFDAATLRAAASLC
jgi:Asp-tRNA(Asn)/Glu-tRNA(Gln) amidotransferase A subunit family amidase